MCKVERGKRYHVPDSPALPDFRFNVEEPFSVVAVDMLGHDWVSNGDKSLEKIYFFFFVCISTGCGHVEMAPALRRLRLRMFSTVSRHEEALRIC